MCEIKLIFLYFECLLLSPICLYSALIVIFNIDNENKCSN